MTLHENQPNEHYEQRIREQPDAPAPTGERGADMGDAGHRPSRPAPLTRGSRLGPAAGVAISGTEGQPLDAEPPTHAEREPAQTHPGPSHGAERVLDDREIAWFSPPTHGNRVSGTRTTGGFDNHPGQPDPDRLRIFAGSPPADAPGHATQDDPLAGFAAEPAPDSGLLPPPAIGRPPVR